MLLSIVLGVSFVSGSFLTADSLRSIFSQITEVAFAGVDAQVRGVRGELSTGDEAIRFSEDVVGQINALPEVEYAEPTLTAIFQVFTLDAAGELNRPQGPPVFAGAWAGESIVSAFSLKDGRAPQGAEIAIDSTQAGNHDIAIGDMIQVSGPGLEELLDVEVSGIVTFGESEALGGAYFNLVDLPTMQALMGSPNTIDGVQINAADGVASPQLLSAVSAALDSDTKLEVVAGSTVASEQSDDFNEIIDILGYVLLGFALVVLFVSIFIIYNTFAILISQRIRQFGLLRSIGATGSQLTSMVMVEALILGVVASIIGLFGGIGISWLLKFLFALGGGEFPDGPIVFKARTIIIVFVLGIGVTVGSAILPAILAQRIPALAALRDGAASSEGKRSRRILFGSIVLGVGVLLTLLGLFGSVDTGPRLAALGFGSALLFIGVAMLSVLFASLATRVLGKPIETAKGLTGRLARDNASRNPQRTAATASALMIGLALITGVLVLTQSIRASLDNLLDDAIAADLFIYDDRQGFPFAGNALDQLEALPEIDAVAASANVKVNLDGTVYDASGFDLETRDSVLNPKLIEGTYNAGGQGVLVHSDAVADSGYVLGDSVSVTFEDDFIQDFEIVGVYDDNTLFDGNLWIFDRSVTAAHTNLDLVDFVGATFASGVDPEVAQNAASAAMGNFPQLAVEDNAQFKATQEGGINAILYLIFGLLALCILVAFIGIVNTMALSILERTREIGLLRAIGTSRKQLRSMVRWEAIIVGIFGAMLGVVLGIIIGYVAVSAIPDSFITEISIPWFAAIIFMIVGGILGMFAAIFPARRAANMNVLDAISSI